MHVYKYQIPVNDQDHIFHLGIEAEIVHVDLQDHADVVVMWVLHNDQEPIQEPKAFRVFGTGHQIPDEYTYVGTTLYRTVKNSHWESASIQSPLVWHLFQRTV